MRELLRVSALGVSSGVDELPDELYLSLHILRALMLAEQCAGLSKDMCLTKMMRIQFSRQEL